MNRSVCAGLSLLLCACQSSQDARPGPTTTTQPTPIAPGALPLSAYSAQQDGFVVHEWGTLTSVTGSDGVLLPGLHHEEEDLPGFVADRLAQAKADPSIVLDPTSQKMETPVTYFYSPTPRTVSVRVDFPNGILTQWYPYVKSLSPPLYLINGVATDRSTQAQGEIPALCQWAFPLSFSNGNLDWGQVQVQAPTSPQALAGPLGDTTWGFARHTASNPLVIANAAGAQAEKFLFYRGLGNFDLPLHARLDSTGPTFTNTDPQAALSGLFLMNVTADQAAFQELGDLGAGLALSAAVPAPAMSHGDFVAALKAKLAARLIADGLYTDEAVAMVDTWERAYFLTPGVRLLYLLPQAHTNQVIPLTITPAPTRVSRTMVIRMELLTPAYEARLSGWLTQLSSPVGAEHDAARASFLGLGRFAEPHLRRAMALSAAQQELAAGQALLVEVQAHKKWAPLAAE